MPLGLRIKKSRRYNVMSKENFVIPVTLLDRSVVECTLTSESSGQECLDRVCQKLEVVECQYFGLKYFTKKLKWRWLELDKPVKKFLERYSQPDVALQFGVMYYVPEVQKLKDEMTRYQYFLQLKNDIIDGKMLCTQDQAVMLAAYSIQAEFGNHDPQNHTVENFKDLVLLPKYMTRDEESLHHLTQDVVAWHATLINILPVQAELCYIMKVQQMEGYGMDNHTVKDESGQELLLGASSVGIFVRQPQGECTVYYKWTDILNVVHNKKTLGIECSCSGDTVFYQLEDSETAKYVWKISILQHKFHLRNRSEGVTPVHKQASLDGRRLLAPDITSFPVPHVPTVDMTPPHTSMFHDEISVDGPIMNASDQFSASSVHRASLVTNQHVHAILNGSVYSLNTQPVIYQNWRSMNNLDDLSIGGAGGGPATSHQRVPSYRAAPHYEEAIRQLSAPDERDPSRASSGLVAYSTPELNHAGRGGGLPATLSFVPSSPTAGPVAGYPSYYATQSSPPPRPSASTPDLGAQMRSGPSMTTSSPDLVPHHRMVHRPLQLQPHHRSAMPLAGTALDKTLEDLPAAVSDNNLLHQQLIPPHPSSRAAPAHTLLPPQLAIYHAKDVSVQSDATFISKELNEEHTSDPTRVYHEAELDSLDGRPAGTTAPRTVVPGGAQGNAAAEYARIGEKKLPANGIETSASSIPSRNVGQDPLPTQSTSGRSLPDVTKHSRAESMDPRVSEIREKINTDRLLHEFEQIPKRRAQCNFTTANMPDNICRNRFRNVLPYEDTRVKIKTSVRNKTGYINASHISIGVKGESKRYIAAQSPMSNTLEDFWQLIWEHNINMIVMLENHESDPKYALYFPTEEGRKNSKKFGQYYIKRKFSSVSPAHRTSTFTVVDVKTKEQRTVWHVQFTAWPDDGSLPDEHGFLDFLYEISNVRREEGIETILVHCTAGVGRSGVVILAEVMLSCLERNEVVDVAKVLAYLRQQRMMLVQTYELYKFVHQVLLRFLLNSRLI